MTDITEITAQVADALYTHGFQPVGILTPTEVDHPPAVLATWRGVVLSVTVEILAQP